MKLLNSEKLNIHFPRYESVTNAFIPSEIYVPLYDNENLRIGTKIKEGDLISMENTTCIRSSIPGKITEIKSAVMPSGKTEKVAVIEMAGAFSYEGKKIIKSEWVLFSSSQIISLLDENGVHNTFFGYENISNIKKIIDDKKNKSPLTLGVRLFDYDPSCLTDSFLFENFYEKVIEGAFVLAKGFEVQKVIFFVSKEQSKFLDNLNFDDFADFNFEFISTFSKKYSFGTKEELNQLLQKQNDHAEVFVDSSTCLAAYEAVALCKPVVDCYVQVSGSVLSKEKFFKLKKGTLIKNLIEECGFCKKEPYKIVINGLLKGIAISNSNIPITDYVKSISILSSKETSEQKQRACIRCGDCFRVCPVGIKPESLFSMYYYNTEIPQELKKLAVKCIQCGRCNTVCPSRIPLYQTISLICENEK